MRLFNLDLHVAVIADVKGVLAELGHEVVSWGISGHEWVFGRRPARVDVVNQATWRGLDRRMCDAFYERYARELDRYDAFVVTHTPAFAMLYERWRKPVIVIASTRYECPFTGDRARWDALDDHLREGIDAGRIVPLANNKYDAAYAERFTGRPWRVIPSLCAYTGARWTGRRREFLYTGFFKGLPLPAGVADRDAVFAPSLLRRAWWKVPGVLRSGPSWQDVADFRGIVTVPYNASVMSLFEQYTAGVPHFLPSLPFLTALHRAHGRAGVMSQLSYAQVEGLPPARVVRGPGDPNDWADSDVMMGWARLSDFYDPENMPHVVQFDSAEHLAHLLATTDLEAVSARMLAHGARRRAAVLQAWGEVLGGLA